MTVEQMGLFGVETVPLATAMGKTVELTLPSAIANRIKQAKAEKAVVQITANLSYEGHRDFERVDRIHESFAEGRRAYLIYAGYRAKPRVQPPPQPVRPSERYESCYLLEEDALAIVRSQRLVALERGTSVALKTGATLRYLMEAIPHPWHLTGTASNVAATLSAARLRPKAKRRPGPGWYQYAAVFTELEADGFHSMQATGRLAYAWKIVRRLAHNNFGAVVLEGIFRHGQHRMSHEKYLELAGEQEGMRGVPGRR
jgi:hypothetical protein